MCLLNFFDLMFNSNVIYKKLQRTSDINELTVVFCIFKYNIRIHLYYIVNCDIIVGNLIHIN